MRMILSKGKKNIFVAVIIALAASLLSIAASAASSGTHTPVTDVSVVVSGATDNSMSNGAVTVTAKGSASVFGFGASAKTATITIYNDSTDTATLAFEWTATSVNQLMIDGTVYTGANGSFSKLLEAGASFTVTITTAKNSTTNTLVMSNFSLTVAAASSKVTVDFDSTLGSVTAGGSAIAPEAVCEATLADGIALVATVNSGTKFLGWVDTSDNSLISPNPSYTFKPATDTTVKAAFASAGSKAWFVVDGAYWTDDLTTAVGLGSTIVLAADGTLPAGNYTIPSGDTLLIPRNSSNTVYTTTPEVEAPDKYVNARPVLYRKLTMANGAKITVNGAISVAGLQCATRPQNGWVIRGYGQIQMNEGSSISISSGGKLYAWGYVTGAGSIEALSGSEVYECFQLADFRGGDATSQMASNTYGVFPMSQFYLQNIEVPLKLYAGAAEKAYTSFNITLVGTTGTNIPIVDGSGKTAMFQISSGYIIKDYLEGTGRTRFEIRGDANVSNVSMTMKLGLLGTTTINSENFNLPIPGHFTIDAVSGNVNINQNLALLPGSELYVRNGVKATLGSVRIIAYSWEDWGNYCGAGNAKYVQLSYVPGGGGTTGREKDALVQIDGYIDAKAGAFYVTTGGANIYSTGTGVIDLTKGTETETHQATQNADKSLNYDPPIDISPAKLKNADGTFVQSGTNTYTYTNGKWICGTHTEVVDAAVAPTCTATGLTEGKHCSVCGEVLLAQNVVAAKGHSATTDVAVAPTCTETGLTEGKHCSACGEVFIAQEVIAATGIHLWEIRTVNGNDHMHSCKYDGCNSFVTLRVEYRLNDYLWFNGYFTEECLVHGGSIEDAGINTAVSNNKLYILKAVPADEIPEEISFTISCATGKGTFTVSLENYDASDDDSLKQALLAYGDAAKDHFGGTSVENAPTKPDLKNDRDKQADELQTMGNLSISTSGATIYFDEAIRLSVKYALNAGENVVIDEVNKTITIDGITYNVVQVGVLLKEMGFAEDGQTWSWNGETLTTVNGMACLTFNVPEITAPEGYLPNQPNVPADPDNPDLKLPGDTMVNEFAVSGEATFNLTAGQYLKGFSLRAFAVLEERDDAGNGTGVYHCIYGKQYGYGLEAYIKRMYGSEDGAFDNLLYWTWNLAQVANGRDPLNATGG